MESLFVGQSTCALEGGLTSMEAGAADQQDVFGLPLSTKSQVNYRVACRIDP